MFRESAQPRRQGADRDCLAYASAIGSLVDRTNYWIGEGVQNLTRFMAGELSYHRYRELEDELLSGLRFEVLRGATGDLLLRESMADLVTGLRELDFRAATFAAGLKALRGQLDKELENDRAAAYPEPTRFGASARSVDSTPTVELPMYNWSTPTYQKASAGL